MNVSYQWLSEMLDLSEVTPNELADKMSRTGIEIEDVHYPSEGLKKIVVGDVREVKPHPDSDHLNICQVDIGEDGLSQIVCGAPNIATGQKVIVALPGARIANNVKIKKGKMRGEVSNGMICSLQELGVSENIVPKKYAEDIYVLPQEAIAGEEVFTYLGMDDAILELSITPNRADALSMRGTAYEVGAIYDQKPHFETHHLEENTEKIADYMKVSVTDENDTPTYLMRIVKNVKVAESPMWLQKKIMNAGMRPINNIVDITNYILMLYGQPLHAFDYDKIGRKEIMVRRGQTGEKLVTLDGEERQLTAENIVITNGQQPLALAGVMGGLDSEITDQTVTVAIEAAAFEAVSIRKTAKQFNLRSEASSRFEKGINMSSIQAACDEAAALMAELGQGEIVSGTAVGSQKKVTDAVVKISLEKINKSLGTEITEAEVLAIMARLGFDTVIQASEFVINIPARRWDIHIEADIIEEVARIYGYDELPATLPITASKPGKLTKKQEIIRVIRQVLEGAGLSQAISYALTTPEKAQQFMLRESYETKLDMPMSEDHSVLRMNLVSGLLTDVAYNVARKNQSVQLYEVGRVFYKDEVRQAKPIEEDHIAGIITGLWQTEDWHHEKQPVDFFVMKGIVELLIDKLGLNAKVTYQQVDEMTEMHPGRTAKILLNDDIVGFVGQVHPKVAKNYEVKETYVFELNVEALVLAMDEKIIYKTISKYPEVTRDMALMVDNQVTHQELNQLIWAKGGKFLADVLLFDVYQGANIELGKKSLAYTLTFRNPEDTLVEEEVTNAFNKILKALEETFHVIVR